MYDREHRVEFSSVAITLCFRHAVQEANRGKHIDVMIWEDDNSSYCVECDEEQIGEHQLTEEDLI